MSKEFTYGINECIDELHTIKSLLSCQSDGQLQLISAYGMSDGQVTLTNVIRERVGNVLKELESLPKGMDGITAIDNLTKNIQKIMNDNDELRKENEKLRKKLSNNGKAKRK